MSLSLLVTVMVCDSDGSLPWGHLWDGLSLLLSHESFHCRWADHHPLEIHQRSGAKWLVKTLSDVKWAVGKACFTLMLPSSLPLSLLPPPLPPPLFTPRVYEGSDFMLIPFERHVKVGCCMLGVMSAFWTGHRWLELLHKPPCLSPRVSPLMTVVRECIVIKVALGKIFMLGATERSV